MLFKKIFIATLAAITFAACSDDKDIDGASQVDAGDVNVTFLAGSSIQTKAESDSRQFIYGNYVNTASVKEYCLKKEIADPEFVIDHLTVFIFDAGGNLVKTAYFSEKLKGEDISGVTVPEDNLSEKANSIYEFGGIVLKEGTYNFILAGNIKADQLASAAKGTTDFEKYKAAVLYWSGDKGIAKGVLTYLPMVKVLENVSLTALKKSANATLNLIGVNDGTAVVAAPEDSKPDAQLTAPDPILLTRLVARIQLKSLAFNWKLDENKQTPNATIKLNKVYLANGSNTSLLIDGNGEGSGFVTGIKSGVENGKIQSSATVDETNLGKQSGYTTLFKNGGEAYSWLGKSDDVTKQLPLNFYAFAKSIKNDDTDIMMILECTYNVEGATSGGETVYYSVPIRNEDTNAGIVANTVYNVNVTLIGQGSSTPGGDSDKEVVKISLTVDPWAEYIVQEENATPKPV